MKYLYTYGWYALLIATIGDLLVSSILAPFYKSYNPLLLTISSLGNPSSPVRGVFNVWMLLEGILFLSALPVIYQTYARISKGLTIMTLLFIAVFAIGACIFTCFFSVNETKDIVTISYILHGFGSVIGFTLFVFVPLFISVLSFRAGDNPFGIFSIISFILGFFFFVLFIMAGKPEFANTFICKEGLWQRLNLLFMYLPLEVIAIKQILQK